MSKFACVALVTVRLPSVMPEPLVIPRVAPVWRFVPTTATLTSAEPWLRLFGVSEVMVGAGVTVNAPLAVTGVAPSGLVTVTSRAVVAAAPEMLRTTDSVVALVRVTELTVTPEPEKATDDAPQVPDTKPVPLTVTVELVTPCGSDAGDDGGDSRSGVDGEGVARGDRRREVGAGDGHVTEPGRRGAGDGHVDRQCGRARAVSPS